MRESPRHHAVRPRTDDERVVYRAAPAVRFVTPGIRQALLIAAASLGIFGLILAPAAGATPEACGKALPPESELPWSSDGTRCTIDTSDVHDPNTGEPVTVLNIQNPVVNKSNFAFKSIILHPGDEIMVSAGGCVQTGGSGATWKRYVDPEGDRSGAEVPEGYHGTITIAGAFAAVPGSPTTYDPTNEVKRWPIYRAIHTKILVPDLIAQGPPPEPQYLYLGYEDDEYSDNGYYAHANDNGTNNQCAAARDGGNAHLRITIAHGKPASALPPAALKAFDLVPNGFDQNWLSLNPQWGWQTNGVFTLHGEGVYEFECGLYSSIGGFVYQDATQPAPMRCTSDQTTPEIAPDPTLLSTGFWRRVLGWFGLCKNGEGHLAGHLNWRDATFTGTAEFDSWAWADEDYNIRLATPAVTGPEGAPSDVGEAPRNEKRINLEFDATETQPYFDSSVFTWWHKLRLVRHKGQVPREYTPVFDASEITGHKAVVTGLVGLDTVHDTGGSEAEVHPVHLLAIEEGNPPNLGDDGWAILVRNWGDEGMCSQDQQNLDAQTISVFLPAPAGTDPNAQAVELPQETRFEGFGGRELKVYPGSATVGGKPGGSWVTFELPPASARGIVLGEVHFRWETLGLHEPTKSAVREKLPTVSPTAGSPSVGDSGDPEERLMAAAEKLTPRQQVGMAEMIPALTNASPAAELKPVPVAVEAGVPSRPNRTPRVRSYFDPQHVADVLAPPLAYCLESRGDPELCPPVFSSGSLSSYPPPAVQTLPGAPPGLLNPPVPIPEHWPGSGPVVGCEHELTGRFNGGLRVARGQVICLRDATVRGGLSVQPGGGLISASSTIDGGLRSKESVYLEVCGGTIDGRTTVEKAIGAVLIGSVSKACLGANLHGATTVTETRGPVEILNSNITGRLTVSDNLGANPDDPRWGAEVGGDHVAGTLACFGDSPPTTNRGVRNEATGGESGQCRGL